MNIDSLKEQARRHEMDEEWQKALDLYRKALAKLEETDESDVSIHNRAADLMVRLGRTEAAVEAYETAIQLYLDADLPNNAIAICRKVVRHLPERVDIYRRMGEIRAEQGFQVDARQNYLIYAEFMQSRGDGEEALAALADLVERVPGDWESRLLLAEGLLQAGRTEEAVPHLRSAWQELAAEGEDLERLEALKERILELQPDIDLEASGVPAAEETPRVEETLEIEDFPAFDEDPEVESFPEFDEDPEVEGFPEFDEDPEIEGFPEFDEAMDAPAAGTAEAPPGGEEELSEAGDGAAGEEDPIFSAEVEGFQSTSLEDFGSFDPDEVEEVEETGSDLPFLSFPEAEEEEGVAAAEPEDLQLDDLPELAAAEGAGEDPHPAEASELLTEEDLEGEPEEEDEDGTPAPAAKESWVNLGSLVLDDEDGEKTTRWVVPAEEPSGDEGADFTRMLSQFKEKVAQNLEGEDARSQYDLGTAYREMGLMDEAITMFQKALRMEPRHLASMEMLGQCFLDRGEPEVAVRVLTRAIEQGSEVEDELVGIYYFIGKAHEEAGNPELAREFYEKVFSLDINFRDITDRLRALR